MKSEFKTLSRARLPSFNALRSIFCHLSSLESFSFLIFSSNAAICSSLLAPSLEVDCSKVDGELNIKYQHTAKIGTPISIKKKYFINFVKKLAMRNILFLKKSLNKTVFDYILQDNFIYSIGLRQPQFLFVQFHHH